MPQVSSLEMPRRKCIDRWSGWVLVRTSWFSTVRQQKLEWIALSAKALKKLG